LVFISFSSFISLSQRREVDAFAVWTAKAKFYWASAKRPGAPVPDGGCAAADAWRRAEAWQWDADYACGCDSASEKFANKRAFLRYDYYIKTVYC